MASKPSDEGKQFVQGIVDGSCYLPVGHPGCKILKPCFDDQKHQCSLDVLPILFDNASHPGSLKYPLDGSRPQDVYSISVTPQEKNNLQCASQLAILRFLEVPSHAKDQDFSDAEPNCIDLHMVGSDAYSSCVVDMNVEKGSLHVPEANEKAVESLKSESVLIRVLRRQASISVVAKIIQLLMNYGATSPRDKAGAERIHDAPNNHWKRYKRSASFDSRKIVLLFSILSIFGTLILIYLTLKVRQQSGDVSIHV